MSPEAVRAVVADWRGRGHLANPELDQALTVVLTELEQSRAELDRVPARLRAAWQDGYTTGFSDQTDLTEGTGS